MVNNSVIQQLKELISPAKRALVTSHVRPDGDAIGSVLALGLALEDSGKDVQMVLADGVPRNFLHLPASERVRNKSAGEFDLICVVDSSDLMRVGNVLNGYGQPHINIDHHVTNLEYAKLNLVDIDAVSTTEILAEIIPPVISPITQPIATALLNGLISDSLGFRTQNMTARVLRMAADLMEIGVDLPELYRKALITRSFEATRFWGIGLEKMQREDGIVWTTLTMEDRQQAGYHGRDDADLITVLSSIEGFEAAIIFVEQPNGNTKVSWRAQPGIDVSELALDFGGGGHPAAAGAEISGELDQIRDSVVFETQELIKEKKGKSTNNSSLV